MKPIAALLLVLTVSPALASKKDEPPYQDATLVSFKTVSDGNHCATNGNTSGTIDSSGNINANQAAYTNCTDRMKALYTIIFAGQQLVVTPTFNTGGKAVSIFSLGVANIIAGSSAMYGQLPGTVVKIRTEGSNYRIKVGKRDSLYRLVEASSF